MPKDSRFLPGDAPDTSDDTDSTRNLTGEASRCPQACRTGQRPMGRCPVNLYCGEIGGGDEDHGVVAGDGRHAIRVQTEMLLPRFLRVRCFANDVGFLFFVHALDAIMRGDRIFRHFPSRFRWLRATPDRLIAPDFAGFDTQGYSP